MLKIGIIGAGFSGTALAVTLARFATQPLQIYLFDKSTCFGLGDAYRTPFSCHLLNVRAKDMSAFEDKPLHFVDWLSAYPQIQTYLAVDKPIQEQFAPRFLYGKYLQALLQQHTLQCVPQAVVDIQLHQEQATLTLADKTHISVDKVVLALGNNPPMHFPFPVAEGVRCITNPWDYTAPQHIATHDPVLIVGTGLSMIDTILTLHEQKHQGAIYAVSRHGLVPLPHTDCQQKMELAYNTLPSSLLALTRHMRGLYKQLQTEGTDWRTLISALRSHIPTLWMGASLSDKKRFIRHVLPYWNIHRHRVHDQLADLLTALQTSQQLQILSGRVLNMQPGMAHIQMRGTAEIRPVPAQWLINCMGPAPTMRKEHQPLLQAILEKGYATLDPLQLGFATNTHGALLNAQNQVSTTLYTLGSPRRSACWESTAVPEIRKQSFNLARYLLAIE